MKNRFLFFILLATLIFITSCGIPYILVPSSSSFRIINNNDNTGKIVVDSELKNNYIKDGYPILHLFYTISNTNNNDNLIKAFNSEFCNNRNGLLINQEENNAFFEYTYGEKKHSLYSLINENNEIIIINESCNYRIEYNNDGRVKLFLLDQDNNEIECINLIRYNRSFFNDTTSIDELDNDDIYEENQTTVYIYALLSAQFDDFTNIFNTELSLTPLLTIKL